MAFPAGHSKAVLSLYRRVLKLHRFLPLEFKALGDEYAKDEFRRHKDCSKEHADLFMAEWKNYCKTLEEQHNSGGDFGKSLEEADINSFSQEQMGQLFELQQEAVKPRTFRDGTEDKYDH